MMLQGRPPSSRFLIGFTPLAKPRSGAWPQSATASWFQVKKQRLGGFVFAETECRARTALRRMIEEGARVHEHVESGAILTHHLGSEITKHVSQMTAIKVSTPDLVLFTRDCYWLLPGLT